MKKLSIQLKNKEIKPMEYAENFPMKVGKHPKAAVIQTALAGFKKKYGVRAYKEIQNDFDVMDVVRHFVVGYMTNLKDAHDALENIKGHKKAFALLVQRAFDESIRVYPWLEGEYYQN